MKPNKGGEEFRLTFRTKTITMAGVYYLRTVSKFYNNAKIHKKTHVHFIPKQNSANPSTELHNTFKQSLNSTQKKPIIIKQQKITFAYYLFDNGLDTCFF